MIFHEADLKGAYIIEIERLNDHRGFFARAWCQKEFEKQNLVSKAKQANVSYNKKKGTLRGMHYQVAPYEDIGVLTIMEADKVDPQRMSVRGFGEYRPLEPNAPDHKGNPKNRRVEIYIIPKGM